MCNIAANSEYEHLFREAERLQANLSALILERDELKYHICPNLQREKEIVKDMVESGHGQKMLPFYFMGWVSCVADTAYQWLFTNTLNNVHVEKGDCSPSKCISCNMCYRTPGHECVFKFR